MAGPSQKCRPAIERAIRASYFFIALISPRSVTKRGFVQKEIKVAFAVLDEMPENQVFLIPVRIGDVEPPDGPMQELHWLDFEPHAEGLQRILSVMQFVPSERQ
jgi:hypothetical protein